MILLHAAGAMLPILLLTAVGWAITRAGWVSEAVEAFMPRLLVSVVVPPYLAASISENMTRAQLGAFALGMIIPAASIIACYVLARAACPLLRVAKKRRALFSVAVAFSNTILIGLPVNLALFGEAAMPACLMYFFPHAFLYWTFGAWVMAVEGMGARPTPGQLVRQVFSAPTLGILAGLALVALDIRLPAWISQACHLLGGACTPLALLYVGVVLCRASWARLASMRHDISLCILGRVVLSPLVVMAMVPLADLPRLTEQVFIIQGGLPVIITVSIYAAFVGADREFGSLMVAMSTIVGIVAVPFWMLAISSLL